MPWEQTATEIQHRVRDPNDFEPDSFRTITLKADRPRVFAVIGKLKGETNTTIQALRFPKEDGWTLAKAQQWVDQNFDKSAHQASSSTTEMTHLDGGPQRVTLGIERLAAHFEGAVNREDRTARLVFYSGAPVRRQGPGGAYDLRFSMDPAHVRLGRLNAGAPLLNSHRDFTVDDVLGVVEKAWLEGGRGVAQVRFSKRADVDPIWQDVQDGILRNASMGVAIHATREEVDNNGGRVVIATDWEPEEVSLVPIGADPGAGFKAAHESKREVKMQNDTMIKGSVSSVDPAAEIRRIVLAARLPQDFAEGLVAAGATLEQARSAVLDKLAAESERVPIRSNSAVVTRDYRENLAERMAEAVACRYTGRRPSEGAREWMSCSVADLARECLIAAGRTPTTRSHSELVRLALTTSDFPNLLSGAGQRMLLDAYQAAQPEIKQVCRQSTARDFRTKTIVRLGEMPELLKVNEHGEITHGAAAEAASSYKLATYARIFSITRQALVNDDLGAFADFARAYGVAAATAEGKILSGLITSNPVMYDGVALFHASHGNLGAGSGSALSLTSLSAARAAMRLQTGLDGKTVLDIQPRFLVVPAALQTTAEQLVAAIYPAQFSDANPFTGRLVVVTDPRLDATSQTAWYLLADPAIAPTIEFSYLEEAPGPQVDFRTGFEVDGIEWRCRLDFGAGAVDWRGAYKAAGA